MTTALATKNALPWVTPEQEHIWLALSAPAKLRAEKLYEVAKAIHAAPHGTKGTLFAQYAAELGYKHVNGLMIPINKYLKTKNWFCLIDRRRDSTTWLKSTDNTLPHAFVEYWKSLVENNQRCLATAYDQLMQQLRLWRNGNPLAAIPGYTTPPLNAPGYLHPAKWSLRDLRRNGPSAIETAAARHGRTEALKHATAVLTTRKGGYPGMELQFDDLHHDTEVVHGDEITRVLEFGGVDYFSNFMLPPGLKPRKHIDGAYKELTEREHALFVVNLFCTVGYSPRGTLAVAENAKAVIRDGLGRKLARWSNDLIKTYTAAMSGAPLISGGYTERAKGSANAKALKEGSGKLYHNMLASLPGQLGMNPADMPAYLTGMRKQTEDILLAQGKLSESLILSHLRFEEYIHIAYDRIARINNRTQHNIEGWLELGLVTTEYLADPTEDRWINIATLPDEQQAAFQIIAAHSPHNFRPRKLSPYEVWTPAAANFIKLSPAAEADCLYEYARRTQPVNAGYFEFQDKDMGLGKFRYRAQYQDHTGNRQYLPNDVEYHLVINPFNPERAFIFTTKGQYLGMTPRHHAAMRSDAEAIHKEQGKKAAHANGLLTAFIVRNGLKDARAMDHNARIAEDGLRATLFPQIHQTHRPTADEPSLYADSDLPAPASDEPTGDDVSRYSLL